MGYAIMIGDTSQELLDAEIPIDVICGLLHESEPRMKKFNMLIEAGRQISIHFDILSKQID